MVFEDALFTSWKDIVTKLCTDNRLFANDRLTMTMVKEHIDQRQCTTVADDRAVMIALAHHLSDNGLRVEGTGR